MRYTAAQYAKALYGLTEANPKDARKTVQTFARRLIANGQAGLVRTIAERFKQEWFTQKGIVPVEITATETGIIVKKELEQALGKSVELIEKKDPSVGAGARIKIGDWQIDNTLSRRLSDLKNALTR